MPVTPLTGKPCFAMCPPLGRMAPRVGSQFRGNPSPASWCGQVAEWLKAADCKSARASVRWFESSPVHHQFLAPEAGSRPAVQSP
ncbi:MAG: hypothetical protein RLZZ136_1435 [Pseudomonadota bacterium]